MIVTKYKNKINKTNHKTNSWEKNKSLNRSIEELGDHYQRWLLVERPPPTTALLDLILNIDLALVYTRTTCNTYPPITKTIAFSGLEKVIIKLTWGGARLFPIITKIDSGIHTYSALLYPLHINTNSMTNDNSKIIALSINLGFPNGIAIKPIAAIETKTISVAR